MTDQPPKLDPESLVLRAPPRRVVRFRRVLLIGAAAVGCVLIAGVAWLALQAPRLRLPAGNALQATGRKAAPDALASLPESYAQMASPKPVPKLGPPLPGDLGPPIVQRESQLGLNPAGPSTEDQAARAERLRLAEQARQARESAVMFRLSQPPVKPEKAPQSTAASGPASSPARGGRLNLDLTQDQNDQQRKLDFLHQAGAGGIYNPHVLRTPVSPYEVLAGTVIAASLLTGLNSDLPGLVTAQVTENVYDSVTGRVLLIPQGARLIGSYDSVVAFGQSRALVAWQRIIMPDGSSIRLDTLPATDEAGYAGLSDGVDYHTWTLLKGIAMATLLGVGTQATFGSDQGNLVEAIRQSTQESANQAGQRLVEKDLNVQPTLTVRPGWPLRVVVHKDLVLRPYRG